MKAVWYERNGAADVLHVGEMPDPVPGAGEVRVRIITSGINPSDWKRRQGLTRSMEFPRIIPHQDGSGVIDRVGPGVPDSRLGERVWLYQAQIGRPFGTAAEYTVQPAMRAIPLPPNTSFAEGAGLGVPAMTAHRCVFADGPVAWQDSAGHRRRRGCWPLCHPVGQAARRPGDRHSQLRPEGADRAGCRCRRDHQLPDGRHRAASEGHHPWGGASITSLR